MLRSNVWASRFSASDGLYGIRVVGDDSGALLLVFDVGSALSIVLFCDVGEIRLMPGDCYNAVRKKRRFAMGKRSDD